MKSLKFNVSLWRRLVLLICVTVLCYIVASVFAGIVLGKGLSASRVCIVTVVQDLFVFIVPALVTAIMITRRPADFLSIGSNPGGLTVILALLALIASIPAMNVIIEWNASISLPAGMNTFAEWMRQMEDSAANTISAMVNGQSVMSLIVMILVVGVFAGFSEELFFRGTLQRMMITANVNPHIAIWITALIFSAVHLQFFGFVPRLLLGAMFGYVAWWSGSVWTAVAAHVLNNTLAATSMWLTARGVAGNAVDLDKFGTGSPVIAIASCIVTACILLLLQKVGERNKLLR